MRATVQLNDVVVAYDEFAALDGVSVDLPEGKTTVILGSSGSGKSTFLKTAAGLIVPTSGKVHLMGFDLSRVGDRELREIRIRNGFAFQDGALWQNMNVWQNISLSTEYHYPNMSTKDVRRRIQPLLDELGIESRLALRPAQLSAGERKIVSFVRAIATDPDLLFMDEPVTFVDNEFAERIVQKLRQLKSRGKTIVIVTHNPEITSQLADYLVILKRGRILEFAALHEVVRSTNPEVIGILSDVLAEAATYDADILTLLDEGSAFGEEPQ